MPRPKPTVLVVDDEQSNRVLAQRVLRRGGYNVTAVENAAEATSVIQAKGGFQLYILDVLMPGARGTELADEIRQVEPDARILFYTANSQTLLLPDRLIPGLEAILHKPVANRKLLEAASLMLFGHTEGPTA